MSSSPQIRPLVWWSCCIALIVSTKYLLSDEAFHYPCTLIIIQLFTASVFLPLLCATREVSIFSRDHLSHHFITAFPAAFCWALALPLLANGLLHLPYLSTWVMMLPLTLITQTLTLAIARLFLTDIESPSFMSVLIPIISTLVSLYCDPGLDLIGLVMTFLGFLSFGLGCGLHRVGLASASTHLTTEYDIHARTLAMFVPLGIALSLAAAAIRDEEVIHNLGAVSQSWFLIALNAAAFVGAIAYSDVPFLEIRSGSKCDSYSVPHTTSPAMALGRVYSLLFVTFIIWWPSRIYQIFFLTIGLLNLMATEMPSSPVKLYGMDSSSSRFSKSLWKALGLLIILSSFTLIFPIFSAPHQLQHQPAFSYEGHYMRRKIDVVISHYDEPIHELKSLVNRIQNLDSIAHLQPRFFIYTKGNMNASEEFRDLCDEAKWIHLPNAGREAATYLHHILAQWDDLAAHTLFVQAKLHNSRGVFHRLSRNFIPLINGFEGSSAYSTGFLSLGTDSSMTSKVSTCQNATDRSSWHDVFGIFPYLFEHLPSVANTSCTIHNKVPLSYHGQFLVSAKRMRQVPKDVYLRLHNALTTSRGWGHEIRGPLRGVNGYDDDVTHPVIGYSVERIWYVLFGCIEPNVMDNCPSLLSSVLWGWFGGEDRLACQYLDRQND